MWLGILNDVGRDIECLIKKYSACIPTYSNMAPGIYYNNTSYTISKIEHITFWQNLGRLSLAKIVQTKHTSPYYKTSMYTLFFMLYLPML